MESPFYEIPISMHLLYFYCVFSDVGHFGLMGNLYKSLFYIIITNSRYFVIFSIMIKLWPGLATKPHQSKGL